MQRVILLTALFLSFTFSTPALTFAEPPPAAPAVEPPLHFGDPIQVTTSSGTLLPLPPGYYLTEPTYSALDTELRRLQDSETRLTTENEHLKKAVDKGSWATVKSWVYGAAIGIAVGAGAVLILK